MCKTHNPRKIDKCMKMLVKNINTFLYPAGFRVVACCCGHNRYNMSIVIRSVDNEYWSPAWELCSDFMIFRDKRFYKKDKQGYYYIPEVYKEEGK